MTIPVRHVSGVPISPVMLEKSFAKGMKVNEDTGDTIYEFNGFRLSLNSISEIDEEEYSLKYDNQYIAMIKYVHQLQNIHFDFKETELELIFE